ncbi:MAG: hypothetical protein E7510_13655 [Ruminococcus sp.]|nr:hypothetical protein [Ruminococcus sp.]
MKNSNTSCSIFKITTLMISLTCIFLTAGCNNKDDDNSKAVEWDFSKQISRQINDDGWVYTFEHFYMKEQTDDVGIIPFTFSGINLRYVYNASGEKAWQLGGENSSVEESADLEKIADLLDYQNQTVTPDDLKHIDVDDIELSVIDENMFVDLVHQALEGEPHKESDKYLLPTYAILAEREFIDNYKFQIGFLSELGCVDVIYIDVLYRSDEANCGYIQLSDMIDSNSASAEQIRAFDLISDISQGIAANNDLMYNKNENKQSIIGNIDFSRLYNFLEDIENDDYMMYIIE